MAKRGHKLQEFVAHTADVNCLSLGKKTYRLFITGGDDHKVNVWSIGKPTSLMSLCGHTSPVESLAFDLAEVLVLAGASSGAIKLWDLEETKMVRGLTGHRSNCTAVEFHPFGEFFASGSMDTNLKLWDIRKKGCIHTYKGHTRGVSTIRFSPDGRWVVSGGLDNSVKVWDLTAGKLLNEFKFHEGHIRSMDFHPLEFLLATGSADGTVKFWDLETFELIGSSRPEAVGVRSITFHPDGKTLFCGSDDGLKVYSWEPVVCHDSVDIGWSILGDLCINEGKLLSCSYYRNSVGVWGADVAHIEPYGRNDLSEKKFNFEGSYSEKAGSGMRSTLGSRPLSPDFETKEIKNIYVDTASSNMIVAPADGSLNSTKIVFPLDASEISNPRDEKQSPGTEVNAKSNVQSGNNPVGKDSVKESITFSRTKPGMLLRPAYVRKSSANKLEVEKLSAAVGSRRLDGEMDLNSQTRLVSEDGAKVSCDEKDSNIMTVTEKSEKMLSPQIPSNHENSNESHNRNKDSNSVKFVNGVAVVRGRTRSLVERFERRDLLDCSVDTTSDSTPPAVPEEDKTPEIVNGGTLISKTEPISANDGIPVENQISRTESSSGCEGDITGSPVPRRESTPPSNRIITEDQLCRRESTFTPDRMIARDQNSRKESTFMPDRMITTNESSKKESTFPLDRMTTRNGSPRKESTFPLDRMTPRNESPRKESTFTPDRMITRNESSRKESTFAHDRMTTRNESPRKESTFAPNRMITRNESSKKESTLSPDRMITGSESSRKELTFDPDRMITRNESSRKESTFTPDRMITRNESSRKESTFAPDRITRSGSSRKESTSAPDRIITRNGRLRKESSVAHDRIITVNQISRRESGSASDRIIMKNQRTISESSSISDGIISRKEAASDNDTSGPNGIIAENQISTRGLSSGNDGNDTIMESQISRGESTSANDGNLTESLMQTHDIFLSTLRSRLTKLQVVRHFWEKNDVKGAIGALRKLPDYSVQADVISVLMEKMEILTLDLFSGLLPVLMGLLDSKTERHVNVSLEMILKLVAVFGQMIRSTVSARRGIGVDLHAEQRRECCNQCFMQLQKIQKLLPPLVRRGGTIARLAQELNLVLQD